MAVEELQSVIPGVPLKTSLEIWAQNLDQNILWSEMTPMETTNQEIVVGQPILNKTAIRGIIN
jgi:hypothetical protein